MFFSNLFFAIRRSALFSDTTYDTMRLARYRLLVRRLLTHSVPRADNAAITARLASYSYVASWADKSEVFGALQLAGSSACQPINQQYINQCTELLSPRSLVVECGALICMIVGCLVFAGIFVALGATLRFLNELTCRVFVIGYRTLITSVARRRRLVSAAPLLSRHFIPHVTRRRTLCRHAVTPSM